MNKHVSQFCEKAQSVLLSHSKARYVLAASCGAMVTLLFSPFEYIIFLFPAISGLFVLLRMAETRRIAFITGWCFGMGMYVSGLYWIANALLVDAKQFAWLIPFVVVGMNGVLAIYSGLLGLVMWWLRLVPLRYLWLAFGISWGALEGLRSVLFTGFPWNLLGYATVFSEPIMQLSHYIPVIWLSVMLVLLGALPVVLVHAKRVVALISITLVVGLFGLVHSWGTKNIDFIEQEQAYQQEKAPVFHRQKTPVYAILQGNIEQALKADPRSKEDQLKTYLSLMDDVRQERFNATVDSEMFERNRPLVFIWPETAFPYFFSEDSHWREFLPTTLQINEVLIAGVVRGERDDKGEMRYYNSVMLVQPDQPILFYDKQHLVPFGEYVPFRNILPFAKIVPGLADFKRGSGGNVVMPAPQTDLANFYTLICYEAIFPRALPKNNRDGAQFIINVTNDGWFGDSIGPHQHLMMARFRAIEQGLPLLRAANSGISATIDSVGRITQTVSLNHKGYILY